MSSVSLFSCAFTQARLGEPMTYETYSMKIDREAAEKCAALLALPLPERRDMVDSVNEFDPWRLFPSLYGSYSREFDDLAIEVLSGLLDDYKPWRRKDLASEMFREMLCTANLCEYGTSPRSCFPTSQFRKLLPTLIEKWVAHRRLMWEE